MATTEDRVLLDKIKEEVAPQVQGKLEPIKGVVVEVGVVGTETEGQARIRRAELEPIDVGRPFMPVVGQMPNIADEVWAVINYAGGFIFGASSEAYSTLAEDGSVKEQQLIANFGLGFDVADNPAGGRTDVTLDPSELLATALAHGFMSMAYAAKLDGLPASAYSTISEAGAIRAQRGQLSFGAGLDATDNPAGLRTDVTLDPSEVLASTTAPGFMSAADKNTLASALQSAYQSVAEAGSARTPRSTLNFAEGLDVVDNPGASRTDVSVSLEEVRSIGAFHAYLGSEHLVPQNSYTKLVFNNTTWDTSNWYDEAQARFEPLEAGIYFFGAQCQLTGVPADGEIWLKLYKNNGASRVMGTRGAGGLGTYDILVHGSCVVDAAPGDFFDVRVFHTFTSRNVVGGWDHNQFWGFFMGRL